MVCVPVLEDSGEHGGPFWRQHADSAARSIHGLPPDQPVVLVGHSGAGPLLPAIRDRIPHDVTAFVFVDAGLPHGGMSRLDDIQRQAPEFAAELRAHLEAGGRFPEWTDEVLRDILPDAALRAELLRELRPRGLSFFEEPLPLLDGGSTVPMGYLLFSEPYRAAAAEARSQGAPCIELEGGHFHMLVDPGAVSDAILSLTRH
jgi:hypothetical protein